MFHFLPGKTLQWFSRCAETKPPHLKARCEHICTAAPACRRISSDVSVSSQSQSSPPPLTPSRVFSADSDSRRPEQVRGPGGGSGWVQVGHSLQLRLDHQGSHGGVQAARAGLRHACCQCK